MMRRTTSSTHGESFGSISRRQFLKGAGVSLATETVAASYPLGQLISLAATPAQALTDLDIVEFALTLENLEATFYKMAVSVGKLSGDALTILTAVRDHEIAHVDALTQVVTQLGGTPPAMNTYDFGDMTTQVERRQP